MGRRIVRGIGRTLIASGVLILLFVAYQLWGTGLAEARAQRDLKDEFEALIGPGTTTTTTFPSSSTTSSGEPTTTTAVPAPPPPPEGSAVAIIKIPDLGLEKAVVEGVGVSDLKKGPGHYPGTPLPGQPGNSAIAGHRTTYGAPFHRLDELRPGADILVTTQQGEFRYQVESTALVSPRQVEVLAATDDNRLTLTTCHPKYTARQRMVVVGKLTGPAAPALPPTTAPPTTAEPGKPAEEPPPLSLDDPAGLAGDPAARSPAILWGVVCALVWLLTWLVGRMWRRWPAYAMGTPVFLVMLFVFFENFARLLPANF